MTTVSDNPVSDPQISCSVDAIAFNDQRLSVGEVLRSLHRHGYLRPLLQKAGEDRVLCLQAERLGFSVTDEHLQSAADEFRQRFGLLSVHETREWLQSRRLTELDFEELILQQLRMEFLVAHVARSAEDWFRADPGLWDRCSYRELLVGSESLAEELKCQHLEEGVSFEELVEQHGGHAPQGEGSVRRSCFRLMLPQAIRAVSRDVTAGSLLGPLACASGWSLVFVDTVTPAVFDEPTEAAVRSQLFQRWTAARISEAAFSFPLLDLLACSNDC
jgi:hypothetical protein